MSLYSWGITYSKVYKECVLEFAPHKWRLPTLGQSLLSGGQQLSTWKLIKRCVKNEKRSSERSYFHTSAHLNSCKSGCSCQTDCIEKLENDRSTLRAWVWCRCTYLTLFPTPICWLTRMWSMMEGWRGGRALTLALLAVSLVAWLANAVVGLGCVLAEGVDVAVVRTLHTLVCICTNINIQTNQL